MTIRIPILVGGEIGPHDEANSPRVCVVNEAFARHFLRENNPIGRHVTVNFALSEIVDVGKDAHVSSLRGAIEPELYAAADQNVGAFSFETHTIGDSTCLVNLVRKTILGIDENLSITEVQANRKSRRRTHSRDSSQIFARHSE